MQACPSSQTSANVGIDISGNNPRLYIGDGEWVADFANYADAELYKITRNGLPETLTLLKKMKLCLSNMLDDGDKTDRTQALEAIAAFDGWNKGDL